jgi:hypothetical protein
MSASTPVLGVVVTLLVVILLVVTNSTEEMHCKALSQEYGHERPVAGAIGLGAVSASLVEHQSVLIGSYTFESAKLMSLDMLGIVWSIAE